MAGGKIRGITIEIGGNTTGLSKALDTVNKKLSPLQKELNTINRQLKFDPKNTVLLAQKQELLSKSIEATKEKLNALEHAQEQVNKKFRAGQIAETQYREFQREIEKTKNSLKSLESQVEKTGNSAKKSFEEFGKKVGETGTKISNAGKAMMPVTGAIAAAGAAAVAAAEGTREYREDMNRLEAAFVTSGKTVESAQKSYRDFYNILGESDRSVEAVNHLAKLCNTEEELAMWSEICAGVSATFGDSLPIEGLTEAANETAKVAKVTGPLADALNWVGISEDKFNESLAECNSEQERSERITNTLAEAYHDAADEFTTMNADVIKSREANQKWNDTIADLGKMAEPILTDLKNMFADLAKSVLGWFSSLTSGQKKALLTIAGITAAIGPLLVAVGNVITSIKGISSALTFLSAHPAVAVVTAIGAVAMACVSLAQIIPDADAEIKELINSVNNSVDAWEDLKESTQQQTESDIAQIEYTNRLWKELQNLADENGKVTDANKDRANFILGELNTALGTEYELNGDIIGQYQDIKNSIDEIIQKKRAEIILCSQEEQYKTAITEIDKRRQENAEMEIEILKKRQELADKLGAEDFAEAMDWIGTGKVRWDLYYNELEDIQEIEAAQKENTRVLEEQLKLREQYESNYAAFLSGNAEDIKEINAGVSENYRITGEETSEEMRKKVSVAAQVYADLLTEVQNGNTNIRQEELDAAAQAYQDACTEYEKVGGAIPEGMKLGIENGKPTLATALSAFISAIKLFFTGEDGFNTGSPSKWAQNIGQWIVEGLWNGIQSGYAWLGESIGNFISWVKSLFTAKDSGFWTGSPSKWSEQLGQWIDEGLAIGIVDNEYKVSDAFQGLMDDLDLKRDLGVVSEEQYYEEMAKLRDDYIKKGTKAWWDYTKKLIQYEEDRQEKAKEEAETASKEWEDELLRNMKWELDMGYLSESEYYDRLGIIKDRFYEKDSSEWQSMTLNIKKFYDSQAESIKQAAEDTARHMLDMAQLDFNLWSVTDGLNASEEDKRKKEIESLTEQLEAQNDIVQELTKSYQESAEAKGADAEESRELQKQLANEKIAQAELQNQINDLENAGSTINSFEAGRDFSRWLGKYAQQFRDFGYNNTDVYKIGAKATGYDKVIGENNMKNITVEQNLVFNSNDMTPSKVARESKTALRQAALAF